MNRYSFTGLLFFGLFGGLVGYSHPFTGWEFWAIILTAHIGGFLCYGILGSK